MDAEERLEALWMAAGGRGTTTLSDDPAVDLARRRLALATAPDWETSARHVAEGLARRAAGDQVAALTQFGWAFAHTAPDTAPLLHVIATFLAAGAFDAAETWGRRVIAAGGDTGDIRLHLAHAAWGAGRHDEALAISTEMVEHFPTHAGVVGTAAMLHNARGDADVALRACLTLLACDAPEGSISSHHHLMTVQAALRADRALPDWCATLLEKAVKTAHAPEDLVHAYALLVLRSAARTAWRDLFAPGAGGDEDRLARTVLRRAKPGLIGQLTESEPAARLVSLHDLEALHAAYPEGLARPDVLEHEGFTRVTGVRLKYVKTEAIGMVERGVLTADFDERTDLCAATRRLQLAAVRDGAITLMTPFGDTATSASSVVLNFDRKRRELGSVIAYFFAQPRPLFAIFATEDHWPVAWYDPERDIILRHGQMAELDLFLQHRIGELKLVCLSDPDLARAYFGGDAARRGRPTSLMVGMLDYLSTHLFSDLQGVSRLLDAGLGPAVARIVLTAPEPLGPVDAFFPELPPALFERPDLDDLVALNRYLWWTNTMATRITGGMVDPGMAGRVVARAAREADPAWRADIDALATSAFPLIFVSLRTHNRRWLADGAEIAGVFAALQARHPALAIVFDGYSQSDVAVPALLASAENTMVQAIVDALPASIPTRISAGRSMEDSIYAAQAAHLQLSAQGTSTTKGVLIAGKPGVVIGPRQFGWDPGAFRDPAPFLVTPWRQAKDAVEGNIQCDYRLDPAVVIAGLEEVLAHEAAARGN